MRRLEATPRGVAPLLLAALVGCADSPAPASIPPLPPIVATCASTSGEVRVRRGGQPYWEQAGVGQTAITTGHRRWSRAQRWKSKFTCRSPSEYSR